MSVPIGNFAEEASKLINEGVDQLLVELGAIFEGEAENAVSVLKRRSPKRTGRYAENWTLKKTGKYAKGERALVGGVYYTIYNKEHYRLTHLLEKGAIRAKTGVTRARPHISPAFEEIKKNIEDKIGG